MGIKPTERENHIKLNEIWKFWVMQQGFCWQVNVIFFTDKFGPQPINIFTLSVRKLFSFYSKNFILQSLPSLRSSTTKNSQTAQHKITSVTILSWSLCMLVPLWLFGWHLKVVNETVAVTTMSWSLCLLVTVALWLIMIEKWTCTHLANVYCVHGQTHFPIQMMKIAMLSEKFPPCQRNAFDYFCQNYIISLFQVLVCCPF